MLFRSGLLFLLGAIVGAYNVWMTIRAARLSAAAADSSADVPVPQPASRALQAGE